jgi:brefeldin A-inhibited guanine nucleotide-exchange protein
MEFLQNLAQDNQTFVDLFLNYDCAIDYKVNVFEVTIENISQVITKVQAEQNWMTPQQEATLKLHGIQTIVSMLNMFVELYKKRTKELQENERVVSQQGREFEISRRKKIDLKDGMNLFNNKSANKGVDLLIRTGHVKRDPVEIAKFLASQSGLNKARIGEFIGQREEFNSQTLKAFVELQNYKGVDFEIAFRNYLNTFRIPGEGQVIDRIVEAFADRYYQQNKDDSIFASHDATHIFAFSIIMLNTELHSPALGVRPRMDLQGFITNNRGINDGQDINQDYLTKIFNGIKLNEIKLLEEAEMLKDQSTELQLGNLPLLKRKQMLYDRETEKIIKSTKAVFGDGRKVPQPDRTTTVTELVENTSGTPHVSAMFEVSWKPTLDCVDHIYDLIVDEKQFTQLCLRAFECGIHIASRYDLDPARTQYVKCVAKYADLSPLPSEVRLLQKNVDCIKLLLKIVDVEGDYLRDSWQPVLNCVSQLELLQETLKGKNGAYANQHGITQQMTEIVKILSLQAAQYKTQQNGSTIMRDMLGAMAINTANQGVSGGIGGQGVHVSSGSGVINSLGQSVDYINAQGLIQQLETHFIDTIFIKSAELSNDAVVDFVKALCSVSLNKEINAPLPISMPSFTDAPTAPTPVASVSTPTSLQPQVPVTPRDSSSRPSFNLTESIQQLQQQVEPRRFSLQKLTEVAYFNMSRKEKIVWALIWYYMAEHFVAVGCHANEGIANYAIDSARTLVLAFMEHDEMLTAIPNFQTSLLHPFLKIVQSSKSHIVREIITKSVGTIMAQRCQNIKNGWKTLLDVISSAIQIPDTNVSFIMSTYKENIDGMIMTKKDYFDAICEAKAFPDLISCLIAFAKRLPVEDTRKSFNVDDLKTGDKRAASTDAIDAIATCATHLGTGVLCGVRQNKEEGVIHFTDADVSLWFPILQGLCKLVSDDPRPEIRKCALSTVTLVLKTHGGKFDSKLWAMVFTQLLCHMFDNIQPQTPTTEVKEEKKVEEAPSKPQSRWKGLASSVASTPEPVSVQVEKKEEKLVEVQIERSVVTNDSLWVRTTCEQALLNVVEIFDYFYNIISFVFDDLLKLIVSCFRQETANKVTLSARLSKIGQNVLIRLIEMSGNKLSSVQWDNICRSLHKLVIVDTNAVSIVVQTFTPKEGTDKLLNPLTNNISTYINAQGAIHYQMIQIVQQILVSQLHRSNTTLQADHVVQLITTLFASYSAAKSLNESDLVTRAKSGSSTLPTKMFLDQETAAVGVYLALLFKMLSGSGIECNALKEPCLQQAEGMIIPVSTELLLRYLTKAEIIKETEEYKAVNSSEMIELIPIVVQILNGFHNDCSTEQFEKYVDSLYEPLSNLVLSEHRVIRVALRHVFIRAKNLK